MRPSETSNGLVAVAAHFSYYYFPPGWQRGWAFYVSMGVLTAWVGYGWRAMAKTWPGVLAGCLLITEGAQQAVCGSLTAWVQPDGRDICRAMIGDDIYRIVGSLALAGLLLVVWRPNPER